MATPFVSEVLIVDDEPLIVEEVKRHLQPHFESVSGSANPAEVVKVLGEGRRYGVYLFDVIMHPLSGLDLLRLAREHDADAQVLMLTADSQAQTVIRALRAGAIDYVVKPVNDWDAVVRSLKRALSDRQLRLDNQRLAEETQRQNAELDRSVRFLRRLNVTSQQMHAVRDAKQVLQIVADAAKECLEARRVSVMIRDPKNDEMAIQVAWGLDESIKRSERVRPWEGVAGTVLAQRAPIVVNDPSEPPVAKTGERSTPYRGQRYLSVPILLHAGEAGSDKVMGVLNVTDRDGDRPFTTVEVEFASHLARQAAYALASAALWKSVTR